MRTRSALVLLALLAAATSVSAQGLAESAAATAAASADLEAVARVAGAPQGPPLSGPVLDEETKRVAALLRCPVCQGLSVADSPADMAVNMRHQVRDLVAAGFREEQILVYFERSYGEFVRLEPPLRGVNWSLWLAPLAGLLLGGGVVFWVLRGPARAAQPGAPRQDEAIPASDGSSARDPLPEDPRLAEYVRRVRELAYGWPGGLRPEGTEKP